MVIINRMGLRTLATIFLTALLAQLPARSQQQQGVRGSERIVVTASDSVLHAARDFIVPGTLTVSLDDSIPLQWPDDFSFDAVDGSLLLSNDLRARLAADTLQGGVHHLLLSYHYRPLTIRNEYYRRRLVTVVDSSGVERSVADASNDGGLGSGGSGIFGRNFQRSGSLVRGFTVGTNRDVTLQSGLRLQFSGFVTDDVEVLGALTDEQTPIQPEGNSRTLREIDNIFFEIRSPWGGATLGKFVATSPVGAGGYAWYSRKLQGVKVQGRYGRSLGTTDLVVALSPGKFRTQNISGSERNQGPYRLSGENNERDIIVVAGTERVFVDGVEMVRGEHDDYVIDYSAADITFQTRRPITGASRITVDFEYSDQRYTRSFVAGTHTAPLLDSSLIISASYIRESDNPDATIDFSLSDADRALLASAGGDRQLAVRPGAYIVGRTDSARGSYIRVDTVINALPDSIYRYDPANPEAVYNVVFSAPTDGRGDYRYVAFGEYEYVGKGLGNYLPIVYLPLPQLQQVASLMLRSRPFRGGSLTGEIAFSDVSLNRFSNDPSAKLNGVAVQLDGRADGDSVTIGSAHIGSLRFNGNLSYIGGGFRTVERLGSVEFDNRWNTTDRPGRSGRTDLIAEGNLLWGPIRRLELQLAGGLLQRGSDFTSLRQQYSTRFTGDTSLPSADYTLELITTDSLAATTKGSWLRQRGGVSWWIKGVTPGFRFESERRDERRPQGNILNGLAPRSYRFIEIGPDIDVDFPFIRMSAKGRYRLEDSARYTSPDSSGYYLRDGSATTYTVRGDLRGINNLSSTLDFTWRQKRFDSVAGVDPSGRLDNITVLVRSQSRWSGFDRGVDLDGLYEVQTEQAARLQRLFQRVPFGQGEYIWIDRDSNGVQSDDEFRLTNAGDGEYVVIILPTEQLFPVIDLRTSFRLRLLPRKLLDGRSGIGAFLAPFTSETSLRLDEKSQSQQESDLYFLRFGTFQSDSTTLVGSSVVQQDLNLFDGNPDYSFRLRYLSRHGLTRLVSTKERTQGIERSLRARWQPTYDIGLQLDLASNHTLLGSTDTTSSRRFDLSKLSSSSELTYRPVEQLEVGWTLKLATSEDILPLLPRSTFQNSNSIRGTYSIEQRGRLQLEVERTSMEGTNVGEDAFSLPYQLTDGYAIGTTWVARLRFEYRFGANIQASINYTGRVQPPTGRLFNIGTAEIRANL